MKNINIMLLCLFLCGFASAQAVQPMADQPELGKPLPNFTLNKITATGTLKVGLNNFKGKWLVLDFFTSSCTSCFQSFPKIEALKEEFKGNVEFLLVGNNEHKYGKHIRGIFERVSKMQNTNIPVAYDSVLFKSWKITSVPYIIIIDTTGTVRALNIQSGDLNSKNLKLLVEKGDASSFSTISFDSWDTHKPFLTNGNGGGDLDFAYRSLLSKWSKPTPHYSPFSIAKYNETYTRKGYQASGSALLKLYHIAYLGVNYIPYDDSLYASVSMQPIFEGIDPKKLEPNSKTGENIFNYSLSVPKERSKIPEIMQIMQRDLMNYFGYEARVETRDMPYWRLTATPEAKKQLKTKGKKYYNESMSRTGMEFGDYPVKILISEIWGFNPTELPMIDETGITSNIDLSFAADMGDFNSIRIALKRKGLILIKGKRKMKVLVFRGPESIKASSGEVFQTN